MFKYLLLICLLGFGCTLDNGIGLTPPMGWNSWNHFGCKINEKLIKETVDLLVSSGLAKKGYKYVNLDDCWQAARDANTKVIVEDKNFPSGMANLGEYIHSKGLLFGLYSDAGFKTCEGRPGSLGYETIDAQTYANWKVDYLKYDNCNTDGSSPKLRYPVMRDALNKTGRRIFFSMCEWGVENPASWAGPVGNSWRTTGDISDKWTSFIGILDKQVGLEKYAGPGQWNDPDMLQVGNGGMTNTEYQSHFALWAALKSPLLIGCDLSKISEPIMKILGNEELIAINQDSLGQQARRVTHDVYSQGIKEVWAGNLTQSRLVVICFNRGSVATEFKVSLTKTLGLPAGAYVSVRDVVAHSQVGIFHTDEVTFSNVASHGVKALVFTVYSSESIQ